MTAVPARYRARTAPANGRARSPSRSCRRASDPEEGWIVTANNAVTDESYPYFIGAEFDPGYRAERIIDLVNDYGQDGLNLPEMSAIQTDTAPLRARDIVLAIADVEAVDRGWHP